MEKKLNWMRYFAPFVGILVCPITILFLWTAFTGPPDSEVETNLIGR